MLPQKGGAIKRWMLASVCPSVPCLILSREWKSIASWKLPGSKRMTRLTREPIYRSKGQWSRSPGRVMPWPKTSHIFGTAGRLYELLTWNTTCAVTSDLKGYNVTSSVWRVLAHRLTKTRSSADAQKPARRDREGGKVSATGWPPTAISYAEGVNVSAGRGVVQQCKIAQRYKTENFLSLPEWQAPLPVRISQL